MSEGRFWLAGGTVVAAVATLGSLWFSLGLDLIPCTLCWYQRILMYPLVVVLGVAALESHNTVWRTVVPLSLVGALIAGYHSVLQATTASCTLAGPCAVVQWQAPMLGLTIPNLSLIAFVLVTITVFAGSNLAEPVRNY
ncbi:disulfide bond formation protein B [Halorubrum sp. CBA1229]|jgi:disulfide bond formation protein DsbB|uniref:disulfide bond formation protein B n=1 Tax=Halorubrum sp. CBA1229 TaxID=1853699 RepID=UPI000F3EECF0|nr:disulfide bond formation protein B [Halorubrum sp. CBA1229]QKY18536.1 disulfide bond formation protein B [Halorubrum sp. CBA1229]